MKTGYAELRTFEFALWPSFPPSLYSNPRNESHFRSFTVGRAFSWNPRRYLYSRTLTSESRENLGRVPGVCICIALISSRRRRSRWRGLRFGMLYQAAISAQNSRVFYGVHVFSSSGLESASTIRLRAFQLSRGTLRGEFFEPLRRWIVTCSWEEFEYSYKIFFKIGFRRSV